MSESIALSHSQRRAPREHGLIGLAERGLVPDSLLRLGIRRLCAQRLREERDGHVEQHWERFNALLEELRQSPLAIHTDAANEQHYELPPKFFELCLGKRLKYSSCYFPRGDESLEAGEDAMLRLYGERAELMDGQDILELGCGWGSLTLWMAERYPNARITAVSNSRLQRTHIEHRCRERGLDNVTVVTADVNRLSLEPARYDRVVSIEMFEHMRNYGTLLHNIGSWLKPGGKLFVHIFCHRELMYPFETEGEDNWMGRHFFTGGLMPAADTLLHFQQDLTLEHQWRLSGRHYERTSNLWLANQDARRNEVLAVLGEAYGADAELWHQRWRMFWMACAELFGYDHGQEWLVGHYRFVRP
ncbi:cyclopropane-fatty-acyl-phospholipid synthase family protein [Oleiagrimonas sp.]|jgi:cyclopropane-fatty-acyl-phospholipid synthase|uniref:SAM-dependent methyltransferase n=1 Tax=Oleiagrimonas sp. TaxID=2010330 RepID=UPI00261A1E5B|nr:cyclopropane-fatty-acyl-phospholipid synthase family protein [Oleiagrimonas sp.]MDA3914665.1 cyclopropane-fatty-acyl-phospholipid synthase [Oleiagrimonas sp.]